MNHNDYNEIKSMVKEAMVSAVTKEAGYIESEFAGDVLRAVGKRARSVTPKSNNFHNPFASAENASKVDFLASPRSDARASRYLAAKRRQPTDGRYGATAEGGDTISGYSPDHFGLKLPNETRSPSREVRREYDGAMSDAKAQFLMVRNKGRRIADKAMDYAKRGKTTEAITAASVARQEHSGGQARDAARRYLAAKAGNPQFQSAQFPQQARSTIENIRIARS